MEKIANIIKEGILIEPTTLETLKKLTEDQLDIVLKETLEERPLVLTDDIINRFLNNVDVDIYYV